MLQLLQILQTCCNCCRLCRLVVTVTDSADLLQPLQILQTCCNCCRLCRLVVTVTDSADLLQLLQILQTCCNCYRFCRLVATVTDPADLLQLLQILQTRVMSTQKCSTIRNAHCPLYSCVAEHTLFLNFKGIGPIFVNLGTQYSTIRLGFQPIISAIICQISLSLIVDKILPITDNNIQSFYSKIGFKKHDLLQIHW